MRALLSKNTGRYALFFSGQSQQKMLGTNVLMARYRFPAQGKARCFLGWLSIEHLIASSSRTFADYFFNFQPHYIQLTSSVCRTLTAGFSGLQMIASNRCSGPT